MIFSCSHGHVLTVDPSRGGEQVRCPLCQEVLTAPRAEPPPVAILVGPPSQLAAPPPVARRADENLQALEITDILPEPAPAPVSPPPYAFAPGPVIPLPEEDAGQATQDRPRKRRRRSQQREETQEESAPDFGVIRQLQLQLRAITLGLDFHYWRYICVALSVLLIMTGEIVGTVVLPVAVALALLSFAAGIAGPVLGILGSLRCRERIIPADARTLILTSLALDIASLALAVCGAMALVLSFVAGLIFLAGSALSNLGASALFMLFLRKLASYLGDEIVAARCLDAMIRYLSVTVAGVVVLASFVAIVAGGLPVLLYFLDLLWVIALVNSLFPVLHAIADVRKCVTER